MTVQQELEGGGDGVKRRDFLYLATATLGLAGAALATWPFIDSMNPAADTRAAGAPVDVDLSPLQPGQPLAGRVRGGNEPYGVAGCARPALGAVAAQAQLEPDRAAGDRDFGGAGGCRGRQAAGEGDADRPQQPQSTLPLSSSIRCMLLRSATSFMRAPSCAPACR